MTSYNCLDDSLRWRDFDRPEAGQSHVEVAQSLQVVRKWFPSCGINSKQGVLSPGRWTTAPHLARDLAAVSGRTFRQALDSRLAKRVSGIQSCVSLTVQQDGQDICETGNISRGHSKNGTCSFQ
ncbi:hypothetical protein TNCV_3440391 [Trichonephila clavipes]|uniref:Uncharacterized protein n=1 Tax=Trichonephila clavipes TaxID=2585209 RepID=A0A8X6W5I3_TRICX|nr:hypothetical protein TNCV_3440391 [Trichonephila clavipes]